MSIDELHGKVRWRERASHDVPCAGMGDCLAADPQSGAIVSIGGASVSEATLW
jgi:hypothetical protein